jgi:hypothetical protein
MCISRAGGILSFIPEKPGTIFMFEVISISLGVNLGCTSPPVLVDLTVVGLLLIAS